LVFEFLNQSFNPIL